METNKKEIVWSIKALKDLKKIYEFNILIFGEEKSFEFIIHLMNEVNLLEDGFVAIGLRYKSKKHPVINYRKLVSYHYIIIYHTKDNEIRIDKVFDSRQNPNKLKL